MKHENLVYLVWGVLALVWLCFAPFVLRAQTKPAPEEPCSVKLAEANVTIAQLKQQVLQLQYQLTQAQYPQVQAEQQKAQQELDAAKKAAEPVKEKK